MPQTLGDRYLDDVRATYRQYKGLADRALEQVDDGGFFAELDDDSNPLALVVKHLAGNLRSRFRDFLTTDGEKPDRHRDREFILEEGDDRASLMARWEEAWGILFAELDGLTADRLETTVTIRHQPHTVLAALQRSLAHVAYHVGQIVVLARHRRQGEWRSLSVPRGGSEAFLAEMTRIWKKS